MSSQLKQRLMIGSIGIVLLTITIYFSHQLWFKPFFILLNAAVIGLSLSEYYHLTTYCHFKPFSEIGLSSAVAYIGIVGLSIYNPFFNEFSALVLLLSLILLFINALNHRINPVGNLAVTIFGLIYIVIPLSCALKINYFFSPTSMQDGRLWLTYVLVVTKMTDMGAYIVGKTAGKTKLAPTISPQKTVEGSLGGLTASLLASYFFYKLSHTQTFSSHFHLTAWQALTMALIFSALSQIGDLSESLLKREAGIKDSSRLPGLGGALDIVDSLIFTLPLMYLLLQLQIVG